MDVTRQLVCLTNVEFCFSVMKTEGRDDPLSDL